MKKHTRLFVLTLTFCLLSAFSLGVLHLSKLDAQGTSPAHQLIAKSDQAVASGGVLIIKKIGQGIRRLLTQ